MRTRACQADFLNVFAAPPGHPTRVLNHTCSQPENVMIDAAGYPKIIDFGFSTVRLGLTFTVLGTPEYLCPEVWEGGAGTEGCEGGRQAGSETARRLEAGSN